MLTIIFQFVLILSSIKIFRSDPIEKQYIWTSPRFNWSYDFGTNGRNHELLHLSVCSSVYLFDATKLFDACPSDHISVILSVRPSVSLSVCPSVRSFTCLSVHLAIFPSVCLSAPPPLCLSFHLSVCQSVPLSTCLSAHMSVHPLICPSVCQSVHISVHL